MRPQLRKTTVALFATLFLMPALQVEAAGRNARGRRAPARVRQGKQAKVGVPSLQTLRTQFRKVFGKDITARQMPRPQAERIAAVLTQERPKANDLRLIAEALDVQLQAKALRDRFNPHPQRSYRNKRRMEERKVKEPEALKAPHVPEARGVFRPEVSSGFKPTNWLAALGMKLKGDILTRVDLTRGLPKIDEQELQRRRVWSKAPKHLNGVISALYGEGRARELISKLEQVMATNARGTYELWAKDVKLLYPETPITPANKPRYRETLHASLQDPNTAMVFTHTYQHTDKESLAVYDGLARRGVPVFAVIGEKTRNHPAKAIWEKSRGRNEGKVNYVFSAVEKQGAGRDYRIDHSKSIVVVKKDGSVEVYSGGINQNTLSHQNIDLSQVFHGGTVGLDALNNMVRYYLRAGGKLERKDLAPLKKAIESMLAARKTRGAIAVEAAATSSTLLGPGLSLSAASLRNELRKDAPLVVSATSFLRATEGAGGGAVLEAMGQASRRGKRIVISLGQKLAKARRDLTKERAAALESAGVDVLSEGTIYVDNAIENAEHALIDRLARAGENISVGAFAFSSGLLAKQLERASETIKGRGKKVDILASHMVIDDHHVNGGNISRLLNSKIFNGSVNVIDEVPGPRDEKGIGRKFHMKVVAGESAYILKTANDSKHGMEVNEEAAYVVSSKKLAKEVQAFLKLAKQTYGKAPKLDYVGSGKTVRERPSLTKRPITDKTKLVDMVFNVADFETDGLSVQTDARPTELVAGLYAFNRRGQLTEHTPRGLPREFGRLINPGKDHLGNDKKISKKATEITKITNEMVRYRAGAVTVMNDFNGWVRTVEKVADRPMMLVGQNIGFDLRMLNDLNNLKGVQDNPYLDGEVVDTLRAMEKISPGKKNKLAIAARRLGVKMPTDGAFHRAGTDIKVTAGLFAKQIERIVKRGVTFKDKSGREVTIGPFDKSFDQITWGDVKAVFLSKEAMHQLQREARAEAAAE